jgi:hypothetical protein
LPQAVFMLGKIYRAAEQPDLAVANFKRAVDITRKNEGLFSLAQLPYLESLINAYVVAEQDGDADREQQYLLRIAERNYSPLDAHFIAAVERQGLWLENQGKFTSARRLYGQAIDLARQTTKTADLRLANELRAVARTYRLEFLLGPEEPEQSVPTRDPTDFSNAGSNTNSVSRINPDAERLLKQAIQFADSSKEAGAPRSKALALIELGDWHWVQNHHKDAEKSYATAWEAFTPAERSASDFATNPLSQPALMLYRQPLAAKRRVGAKEGDFAEKFAEYIYSVTTDGKVADLKLGGANASEANQHSIQAALRKAQYRPRMQAGKLVQTDGVHYRQRVFEKT